MSELFFFVREYRRELVVLMPVLAITAIIENLAIASLYPLLAVVLGTEDLILGGPILGSLGAWVSSYPQQERMFAAIALFLLILPFNVGGKFLRERLQASVVARLTYDVKQRVFRRMAGAPYAFFVQSSQGDLAYRLSTAPVNLSFGLLVLAMITSFAITGTATLVLLLSIEPRITLIVFALGAAFYWLNRVVARRVSVGAGREKLDAHSAELGTIQDFLTGAKEIAVAGAMETWIRRFAKQGDRFRRHYVRDYVASVGPGLMLEFVVFGGAALAAILLRVLAPTAVVTLLPLVAVYVYAMRQLLGFVGAISRMSLRLAAVTPDAVLLRRALTEAYPSLPDGSRSPGSWSTLELSDVGFQHPGVEVPTLRGVDLIIERGGVTAIVGGSGAGKTTILNLILRLFDPTSGRVLIDGIDLREYRRAEWLAQLGYVPHELFVHAGTVTENIAFGRPASKGDIEAAAKAAHADEFVLALQHGYDTVLGDRGVTLSAGQRQRLVIARAMLLRPKLLLLDEATSSLDSDSERLVQAALDRLAQTCTVVVVAHRLSTIRHAGTVFVLQDGQIVEHGPPAELSLRHGPYSRLMGVQAVGSL